MEVMTSRIPGTTHTGALLASTGSALVRYVSLASGPPSPGLGWATSVATAGSDDSVAAALGVAALVVGEAFGVFDVVGECGAAGVLAAGGGWVVTGAVVWVTGGGVLDVPPELWCPLGWEPPLCRLVGLWVGCCVGLWVGLWVGLCVGCGGGGADVGCTVAVGVLDGATVAVGVLVGAGVDWVGAAATGEKAGEPPEPSALCGHHATRQAARPSNAATAKRTMFVQVLLTTSS